ncbi:MAG: MarR family winged helix-turn-helix transcriptional regulator [Romboutsia sp.]|uniref:MarR family winged helix-turn-helix transcriptional regulator n=1 Tax=Romboutsia sp. TaxID=1965302 RepID=UPI003F2A5658
MKKYETESISRYINQLYRKGISFLGKEYKEYGIGAGQYQFLVYLYIKDGLTHEELTEKIGVDKAATTRAIVKLEDVGYITRVQDESDKRKYYIYLTEYAKEKRHEILEISKKWEAELTSELSEETLEQLYSVFRTMTKTTEVKEFKDEEI